MARARVILGGPHKHFALHVPQCVSYSDHGVKLLMLLQRFSLASDTLEYYIETLALT